MRVCFASPEEFQREYAANLVNGGVFVAGEAPFELREPVQVELRLAFCDAALPLEGEVVHRVPPELARAGATPGVAVQLRGTAAEIRARLEPLARACSAAPPPEPELGRRNSQRVRAHVAARIDADGARLAGRTRDLSLTGALIDVTGDAPPAGRRVRLTLEHPRSGEALEVEGTVARQVQTGDAVTAVAVHFEPERAQQQPLAAFVEGVQSAERSRRLGGISGALSELGPESLLAMLTASAPAGTLSMRRGEEEGTVGFQAGLLRYARLGTATGIKALARLLTWSEGSFEFHAHLEPFATSEPPLPLQGAVLEAVQQLDELRRLDRKRFPDELVPRPGPGSADEALGKLEQAVLDLARVGSSIRRIVDVVPEPDPQVYRALADLADRGLLELS